MSTIDVDALALKLEAASSVIDLVCTLKSTGDIESLNEQTLFVSLSVALDMIEDARAIIRGGHQGAGA